MTERPSVAEVLMAAIAGAAFAGSALFVRSATFLPAAFFDALVVVFLAWGTAPAVARWASWPAATLLRGVGFAGAALLAATELVPPFDRGALPVAVWVVGGAMLQAEARATRRAPWLGWTGGLVVVAGTAIGLAFATGFPDPFRLRVVVAAATLAALGGLGARAWALHRGHEALAPRPVGILLVAALGAAYLGYRGAVATQVANLPLYEWTLGVAVAALVLARLRRGARETATPEAWASDARRHAQDVGPVYDERMVPVAAAIVRYLETGAGFDEYRAALRRAHPGAVARIDATRAVLGRGGRATRLRAHDELTREATHGHPQPRVRAHP